MNFSEMDQLSKEYANRFCKKMGAPASMCGFLAGGAVYTVIAVFKGLASLSEEFGFIGQLTISIIVGVGLWLYFRSVEKQWWEHYRQEFQRLENNDKKTSTVKISN